VRSAAITSFYGLENAELNDYSPLFEAFLDSQSLVDDSSTVLHVLTSARQPLPSIALDICERTIALHGQALGDITSASAAVGRYVAELAVRLHAQHTDPEMRRRCLDLIDLLVAAGAEGIDGDLAKIER
jgi:hypothetical protein